MTTPRRWPLAVTHCDLNVNANRRSARTWA